MQSKLLTFLVPLTLALSAPAIAHEADAPDPKRLHGSAINLGVGVGAPHGIGGFTAEYDLRAPMGLGLSVHGNAGPTAAVGAHIWSPGQRLRFGLGSSFGMSWNQLVETGPGADCSGPPKPESKQDKSGVVHIGIDFAIDHDIGERGAWGMRYGAGASAVFTGCAGGVLPLPTLALYRRF